RGLAPTRPVRRLRRAEPGARPVPGRLARGVRRRVGARRDRGTHAAGEVRARRRRRRSTGLTALPGRADARRAGAVRGARRQLPGARRADESPRPRGDRGARVRARDLPRLPRRGDARPPLPRAAGRDSYDRAMTVEEMRPEDWPACARIYEEGLDVGTFE